MTTASAPATSSERRNPLIHRIASLSNKNEEILDQINKLQHSHSQTLNVINSQLGTFSHTDDSGQHIDSLVNSLKSRQRRSNSLQQQSISSVLKSDKMSNGKDLEDVMEVEDNYEINESKTITADDSLSSRKSAKLVMANRNVKELKKIENLNSNNGGELDWKYFSADNNSDSENGNENTNSMEDKDFENMNDNNSRRKYPKGHPTLTINTNTAKSSQRLITPDSSDSEFDISNAHMPLAPTLGGSRNPLRVARHSSAELYNVNMDQRGRAANSLFSSMDGVIEEERGSLSDIAEQSEVNTSENINRIRGKQITTMNGRKRAQKYLDDYNVLNDASKAIKMHRRPVDDSFADIPDDNSSAMSTDSFIQSEVEELRARIQKLESERASDENMSERKSHRRKKHYSDSIISPAALSPDSSQGGASSTTSYSRHSSVSAQHQKHLQNAFDMFEKAFTADYPTDDSSPPPSHSMAMVVSSALSLNQKLRSVMTQMELDGQLSEKGLKALLKTSDEQVRSLTECLLALAPLAPKRTLSKKVSGERDQLGIRGHVYYPSDSSLLQMPTPSHSTRSISPIPRISSAPILAPHEPQIGEHVDQSSSRRVSPIPPSDQSSPPNSYYAQPRTTSRYNRSSRPSSPTLQPEDSQILTSRERKLRRSSGTAYNSYSGTNPISSLSPSPPPPPTYYDQPGTRSYYEPREAPRELPRLQRFSLQGYNSSSQSYQAYQRTTSRPLPHVRIDESSHPISGHVRTSSASSITSISSIHRSPSGRYASRVTNEEYVNSPVSATRSQPPSRLYEYTRRYPSDGQSPMDRRSTPGLETDRRYSRRIVNQYEPEDSYVGPNGYGENVSERDYIRDDKTGIRRSISDNSSNNKQRMIPAQEQEVNCSAGAGNEESRGESNQKNDEINHDADQNIQVNCSNVENGEVNEYI